MRRRFIYLSLLSLFILLQGLFAQEAPNPRETRLLERDELGYIRPARLKEEDKKKNKTFIFSTGLEIICDIDNVKVSIFDKESGRTPFELNKIAPGSYRIRLEKPGYPQYTFWVNIKNNFRTTVFFNFGNKETAYDNTEIKPSLFLQEHYYSSINPNDSPYYSTFFLNNQVQDDFALLFDAQDKPIISLSKQSDKEKRDFFYWNGKNIQGSPLPDGEYKLKLINEKKTIPFRLDRSFSRKGLSYFSGMAGLSLAPTAKLINKGTFQFKTGLGFYQQFVSPQSTSGIPYNILFRFSIKEGWESAFWGEITLSETSSENVFALNTSQKIKLFSNHFFTLATAGAFSYQSKLSNFSDPAGSTMGINPGLKLNIPCQFTIGSWEFLIAPELNYYIESINAKTQESVQNDFGGNLSWGIAYAKSLFNIGYSTALYTPTIKKNYFARKIALDMGITFPRSPIYVNLNGVFQDNLSIKTRENINRAYFVGFDLGFVF